VKRVHVAEIFTCVRGNKKICSVLLSTVSSKNAPTLASCSFDEHGLIFIILGKQHQHTFKNYFSYSNFLISSLLLTREKNAGFILADVQ